MCTAKYSSKKELTDCLVTVCRVRVVEAFSTTDGLALVKESVRLVLQELIEAEASQHFCAARYERTPDRTTERNGARAKVITTQAGDVALRIPKAR